VVAVEEPVSKVTFDKKTDFKFSAAYEVYSKAFDEVPDAEKRRQLNDLVSRLSRDEMSYPRFYREIDQFREDTGGREFRRARIQGQRKKAYRHEQLEKDRSKRYRK
jgi:hypothetical protein